MRKNCQLDNHGKRKYLKEEKLLFFQQRLIFWEVKKRTIFSDICEYAVKFENWRFEKCKAKGTNLQSEISHQQYALRSFGNDTFSALWIYFDLFVDKIADVY